MSGGGLLAPHRGPAADQMIWFNANGVVMEQILPFIAAYAQDVGVNAIVFNYRGVGASTGWPYTADLLTADGRAIVHYLTKQHNVPSVRLNPAAMFFYPD